MSDIIWSQVDRSGGAKACWVWTGSTDRKGYGRLRRRHGMSDLIAKIERHLDAMEAAALAATPGPWEAMVGDSGLSYRSLNAYVITADLGDHVADANHDGDAEGPHGAEGADAYHIALNDPAAVLALVAGLRAVLALHSERDDPPSSFIRCDECGDHRGWPCPTLLAIAAIWEPA